MSKKSKMVHAICQELRLQRDFLEGERISTIYFGGGTPSLLDEKELELLLNTLHQHFPVDENAEITLEANPDDLNEKNLAIFYRMRINRLSIGIQTFDEEQLRFLNRAHTSKEAKTAFLLARDAGFKNISIDLIYGIPSNDHRIWESDLAIATGLSPEHISSYCLTIEPRTVFGHKVAKGKMPSIEEEYAAVQFEMLIQHLSRHGYDQYEISNFCKPYYYSRHNTNYWKQEKYLGVGPGAHSYNKVFRQFNCSNNAQYLRALSEKSVPFEKDMLDETARINEYIMTSLRTKWGCDLQWLKNNYHFDLESNYSQYLKKLAGEKLAYTKANHLILTDKGKLLADKITEDLFL